MAYATPSLASQGFSAQEPTQRAAVDRAVQNNKLILQAALAQIGKVEAAATRYAGFDQNKVVHIA